MAALLGNPLLLTSAASDDAEYQIEKSLRFSEDDDAYLVQSAPGASGNRRTWTLNFWFKRTTTGGQGSSDYIFGCGPDANNTLYVYMDSTTLRVYSSEGGTNDTSMTTTQVFRDPGAWQMHTLAINTTLATEADRLRYYINGREITEWSNVNYPSLNAELQVNKDVNHYIGRTHDATTDPLLDAYLADVHFVDGLQLSPAAFGSFDSNTGVWNPKAFALPAPNNGTTWSSSLTNDQNNGFNNSTSAANLFDGVLTTEISGNGNFTFTPPGDGIAFSQAVEVYYDYGSNAGGEDEDAKVNDGNWIRLKHQQWTTVSKGSGTLTTLKFRDYRGTAFDTNGPRAVRVDGVVLLDGKTDPTTRNNPNEGQEYSSGTEAGTAMNSSNDADNAFDGSLTTSNSMVAANNSTYSVTLPSPVTVKYNVRLRCHQQAAGTKAKAYITPTGGSSTAYSSADTFATAKWVNVFAGTGELTKLEVNSDSSGDKAGIQAVEVDGHILVDNTKDNSFHLKFSDTAANRNLGYSQVMNTATGAQPMYGPGADDSAKSDLKLALPGYDLNDHHHTIKGSGSAKTITANGNTTTSATKRKFYDKAIYFDGDGDYLTTGSNTDFATGTSAFTYELWFYWINESTNASLGGTRGSGNDANAWSIAIIPGSGNRIQMWTDDANNLTTGGVTAEQWTHFACVRDGSNNMKFYINGKQESSDTVNNNFTTSGTGLTLGDDGGSGANEFKGYVQDVRFYKGTAKYTANFKPPTRNDFAVNNLAHDTGGTSVASATGAKPILTATDSFGTTTGGSVDTTDPAKAHIKLALPFQDDTNDVHHTVKGSGSARTVTTINAAYTTNAKYYGGAGNFTDTTNDFSNQVSNSDGHFDVGTGNVTIEWWAYYPSTVSTNGYIFRSDTNNGDECYAYAHNSGTVAVKFAGFTWDAWPGSGGSHTDFNNGEWVHFCIMRSGSTWTAYINGEAKRTTTNAVDFNPGDTMGIGNYNNASSQYHARCYLQDFRWYNTDKYSGDFTVPAAPTIAELGGQDSLVDTPTNYEPDDGDSGVGGEVRGNYCTINPLSGTSSNIAFSQGNLEWSHTHVGNRSITGCTFLLNKGTGKYYFEHTATGDKCSVGIQQASDIPGMTSSGHTVAQSGIGYAINFGGTASSGTWGGTAPSGTHTNGSILGVAVDTDNGKLWFYKDGVIMHSSGNPATGANGLTIDAAGWPYVPTFSDASTQGTASGIFNFGARPFKYTAPSGFKCLCTQNLPDLFSGDELNKPSKCFDTVTYSGTGLASGATESVTIGFGPDFIWQKKRSGENHSVHDVVRGAGKEIHTNNNNVENTSSETVTAFNSNGWTYGANSRYAGENDAYVTWLWDAGTAGAANNDGSINVTNQWANTAAGFSITKYEGTGANATVGHGLNTKPEFVMIKPLELAEDWIVGHASRSFEKYLHLNLDNAEADHDSLFNDTDPTNTVVSLGTADSTNASSKDHIMYCWAPIKSYSAMGSYTGNGADNGPFIYTGMKPGWLMIKRTDAVKGWFLIDAVRNPTNVIQGSLFPHDTTAEHTGTGHEIDFLSNGFKIRKNNDRHNASGGTYIYVCFAEHPFKLSRAR